MKYMSLLNSIKDNFSRVLPMFSTMVYGLSEL